MQTHEHKQSSRNGLNLSHIWQNTACSWSYKNLRLECSIKFARPGSDHQSELQVGCAQYLPSQKSAPEAACHPAGGSGRQTQGLFLAAP